MKHTILILFSFSLILSLNYTLAGGGGSGNSVGSPGNGDYVGPPPGLPSCGDEDPPGNTACTATPICNINGYCGTTSSSYSADYWSQLNSEFCGSIENNAFLTFTAESSTISFDAYVYSCRNNEAIQVFIFGANDCSSGSIQNIECVNEMYAQDTPYNVSASGLTPGEEYYIMIDGYAGDVCDYTFVATSGISMPVSIEIGGLGTSTICLGESVVLNADGGDGTYTWDPSPDLSDVNGSIVTATPPSVVGAYNYVVHSDASTSLCPSLTTDTVTIIVEDCACHPITVSNTGPVCDEGLFDLEATLTSGNVTSTSWSGPNGFTSSVLNPTDITAPSAAGSYDYTLTATIDGSLCTYTTTLNVTDCSGPCDVMAIRNAFEAEGCVELDACISECSMYFLNPQSMTGSNAQAFAEGLGANLVSIQSQAENDCILNALNALGETGTIWIGLNDEDVEGTFVWYDQSPVNYTNWAPGEPNNSGGNENCVQIYPTGSSPGMWNDLNCGANNSKSIIEVNLCPVVDAGPNITICEGDTAVIQSSPTILGSAPYTYEWDNNGPTTYENSVAPTVTTEYVLTSLDRYSCIGTDAMTVEVNGLPAVSAGADTSLCYGDTIILNETGPHTYTWNNGVDNGVPFASDSSRTYVVTATDVNGCINSDSIDVTVNPNPNSNFVGDYLDGCAPHTVIFTDSSNLSNAICTWSFGDGEISNICDSVAHTYMDTGQYDVTLTVESAEGCVTTTTKTSYIEIFDNPIASFTADPMLTDYSNAEVEFTNESTNSTNYVWDFGDNSNTSNDVNPTHNFPDDKIGEYSVVLYAMNDIGCIDSTTLVITIVYPEIKYEIPNVFTPNGDNNNDFFKLINAENILDLEVIILNRWGNLVFESNDIHFMWNGLKNNDGTECTDGTYFYKMILSNMSGEKVEEHGFVQLSRGN